MTDDLGFPIPGAAISSGLFSGGKLTRLHKGDKGASARSEKLARAQMAQGAKQHKELLALQQAQLELAGETPPPPAPTPPPVVETAADVAQAEDRVRDKLRAKSGRRTVYAGLGGVTTSLGAMGTAGK